MMIKERPAYHGDEVGAPTGPRPAGCRTPSAMSCLPRFQVRMDPSVWPWVRGGACLFWLSCGGPGRLQGQRLTLGGNVVFPRSTGRGSPRGQLVVPTPRPVHDGGPPSPAGCHLGRRIHWLLILVPSVAWLAFVPCVPLFLAGSWFVCAKSKIQGKDHNISTETGNAHKYVSQRSSEILHWMHDDDD